MKLIHTADLHLDAKMQTHLPKHLARERRRELLAAFERLAAYAEEIGAALLLAGDIFDTEAPSRAALTLVKDVIKRHADVPFLLLTGNHEGEHFRLFEDGELPENLTLFGDTLKTVSFPDCDIYGYSGESFPYEEFGPDKERKNILLLHGAVKKSGKPKPHEVVLSLLADRGIDYLALGHYHTYQSGAIDKRGVYAYAGCPEGRGFDECGPHGFILLDTEGEGISHSFIPFAGRTLHEITVDISALPDWQAVETEADRRLSLIPEEDMVKLRLLGSFPEGFLKDTAHLSVALPERFFFAEVKDESRLLIEPDAYRNDISLKGEFIRRVLSAGFPPDKESRIILAGLAALRGEEPET